jgi:hypothetical protein
VARVAACFRLATPCGIEATVQLGVARRGVLNALLHVAFNLRDLPVRVPLAAQGREMASDFGRCFAACEN